MFAGKAELALGWKEFLNSKMITKDSYATSTDNEMGNVDHIEIEYSFSELDKWDFLIRKLLKAGIKLENIHKLVLNEFWNERDFKKVYGKHFVKKRQLQIISLTSHPNIQLLAQSYRVLIPLTWLSQNLPSVRFFKREELSLILPSLTEKKVFSFGLSKNLRYETSSIEFHLTNDEDLSFWSSNPDANISLLKAISETTLQETLEVLQIPPPELGSMIPYMAKEMGLGMVKF
ncbi:unnamed protein product [Moneuplotes crassus]|uniref:Uncharacterized protein n=1 Tax=Euplotes crassus TaxID=5936 RepID=A0AAD2D4T8_EUPCR|nr:unnamed protein product [Moneuplotes crassus]